MPPCRNAIREVVELLGLLLPFVARLVLIGSRKMLLPEPSIVLQVALKELHEVERHHGVRLRDVHNALLDDGHVFGGVRELLLHGLQAVEGALRQVRLDVRVSSLLQERRDEVGGRLGAQLDPVEHHLLDHFDVGVAKTSFETEAGKIPGNATA